MEKKMENREYMTKHEHKIELFKMKNKTKCKRRLFEYDRIQDELYQNEEMKGKTKHFKT